MANCSKLKRTDAQAYQLCRLLKEANIGLRRITPSDVYVQTTERMESEQQKVAKCLFGGSGLHNYKCKIHNGFTRSVHSRTSFRILTLFSDFDNGDSGDEHSLRSFYGTLIRMKEDIKGYKPGTVAFRRELLKQYVAWKEGARRRKKYVVGERSNLEMLSNNAEGDCTEHARFDYAALKLIGFKPRFLDVRKNAIDPKAKYHVCIGVALDPKRPNELTQVDTYYKGFWGKSHPKVVPLSTTKRLALFESNKGAHWSSVINSLLGYIKKPLEGSPLDKVLQVFFKVLAAVGVYVVKSIMIGHYERALRYDRSFAGAYYNIADVKYATGESMREVRKYNDKALSLRPDHPGALELRRILRKRR